MNGELRESQRRYRELIRLLPAAIYTCDARGRVELYNQAAVDLWGREPEAGETFWCGSWRIYLPDGPELPLDQCPMAVAIKEGRPVRGEIVIERPDGERRNVLANANPSLDAQGSVTGAVNLLMDITGQTEGEEARAHLAAIVDSSDDAIWISTSTRRRCSITFPISWTTSSRRCARTRANGRTSRAPGDMVGSDWKSAWTSAA